MRRAVASVCLVAFTSGCFSFSYGEPQPDPEREGALAERQVVVGLYPGFGSYALSEPLASEEGSRVAYGSGLLVLATVTNLVFLFPTYLSWVLERRRQWKPPFRDEGFRSLMCLMSLVGYCKSEWRPTSEATPEA